MGDHHVGLQARLMSQVSFEECTEPLLCDPAAWPMSQSKAPMHFLFASMPQRDTAVRSEPNLLGIDFNSATADVIDADAMTGSASTWWRGPPSGGQLAHPTAAVPCVEFDPLPAAGRAGTAKADGLLGGRPDVRQPQRHEQHEQQHE